MKKSIKAIMAGIMAIGLLTACVPSTKEEVKETEISKVEATETAAEADKSESAGNLPKIGIIQLMEHTSLNIIYDSLSEELKTLGYIDGETADIDFQNAQGEMTNIASIVQGFAGDKKDVVIAITTPVAQGAVSLTKDTPVVFTAVTDPVAAGIVTSFDVTDKGMTGTSDVIQVDKILDLALTITPDIKTVGTIYNAGEDNSVSNVAKAKEYLDGKGISLEEVTISSSADLQTAAAALVEKVDAIFVANDNTVAEAMPILMQVANTAKVPVYVGADSMVMDGGFATVGIDYTDLGKESARMADEILKGKKTSEIPVKVFKDDLNIYVNTDTAAALGIEIPESILNNEKYQEIKNK